MSIVNIFIGILLIKFRNSMGKFFWVGTAPGPTADKALGDKAYIIPLFFGILCIVGGATLLILGILDISVLNR